MCVKLSNYLLTTSCNIHVYHTSDRFRRVSQNWKNATALFQKHEQSACHREAVDVVLTLPATTKDIGEQLSQQHAKEKESNQKMLLKILSSIKYLARQGLDLRGDGDEADSNFLQLLQLKAEEDPVVIEWLKRKTRHVMRDIRTCMQQSPFLALMMDETTDISNNE